MYLVVKNFSPVLLPGPRIILRLRSLFSLFDEVKQGHHFRMRGPAESLFHLLIRQLLAKKSFHVKVLKPAVERLETWKVTPLRATIRKGNLMAQSWTPDHVIITWRNDLFTHGVFSRSPREESNSRQSGGP
ncbi:MAG: hypothetical protein R6V25_01540 [Desulfatiglandales bacterium]